jgi:hypothetical protein
MKRLKPTYLLLFHFFNFKKSWQSEANIRLIAFPKTWLPNRTSIYDDLAWLLWSPFIRNRTKACYVYYAIKLFLSFSHSPSTSVFIRTYWCPEKWNVSWSISTMSLFFPLFHFHSPATPVSSSLLNCHCKMSKLRKIPSKMPLPSSTPTPTI